MRFLQAGSLIVVLTLAMLSPQLSAQQSVLPQKKADDSKNQDSKTDDSKSVESKARHDAKMAWWREARFGMFIHWSLFAVPEGTWKGQQTSGPGEWIMNQLKIPVADYKAQSALFNPVKFDADKWVSIAKAAGVKYIVITAKHHDGFAMFRSEANPFNIVDATPYHHDPMKDLAAACRKHGIKLGFYYSQDQDWTAPGGAALGGHWDPKAQDGSFAQYLKTKAIPQIRELLSNYQPYPAVLWFDTPTPDMTPELAGQILALLKDHPNLIWNNRLGGGNPGDTETPEGFIPANGYPRDWETCMNINDTWGYKSFDLNFKSTETLLRNLIDIASKGGNYLLNVGPTPEGEIPQPEVDRLLAMGAWLKVNGAAIYGTQASPFPKQLPWGRVTQKPGRMYLHVFDWPKEGSLLVPITNTNATAALMVEPTHPLPVTNTPEGLLISLPAEAPDKIASVVVLKIKGAPELVLPQPVAQAADGTIHLTPEEATLTGSLQVEGAGEKNIGYWLNATDTASWNMKVTQPGTFDVVFNYALDGGSAGSEVLVSAGDAKLLFHPAATQAWTDFQTNSPGQLKIDKAAVISLILQPTKKPGLAVANLRSVTLVPSH